MFLGTAKNQNYFFVNAWLHTTTKALSIYLHTSLFILIEHHTPFLYYTARANLFSHSLDFSFLPNRLSPNLLRKKLLITRRQVGHQSFNNFLRLWKQQHPTPHYHHTKYNNEKVYKMTKKKEEEERLVSFYKIFVLVTLPPYIPLPSLVVAIFNFHSLYIVFVRAHFVSSSFVFW